MNMFELIMLWLGWVGGKLILDSSVCGWVC